MSTAVTIHFATDNLMTPDWLFVSLVLVFEPHLIGNGSYMYNKPQHSTEHAYHACVTRQRPQTQVPIQHVSGLCEWDLLQTAT